MESSLERQIVLLSEYKFRCLNGLNESSTDGFSCPQTWDGLLCWPRTTAGQQARQLCPHYVHGFDSRAFASRRCDSDATWWVNPTHNQTWSNYTLCTPESPFAANSTLQVHVPIIKSISQVGYAISLALLLVACLVLASFRRLRCPRNHLHLQLFASFVLRAAVSLLRDLAGGSQGSLWCKALMCVWQYCLMANYSWILMEGLYLHNLLFLAIFSDAASIFKYAVAGWGLPLLFVVPWIVVRALWEDSLCWTVNENQLYFWIIRGPITASILLNLAFFLNIARVLFLKMFSNEAVQNRRYKYRKWFKSTLVLVPLFGVHYALLLSFSFGQSGTIEIVWLYVDQTFSSFQGSFVAFLYCFLNGEVKAELRKVVDRLREKEPNPQHSLLTQSLTYLSKGRASLQSLHTVADRRDNWRNGEERPNWAGGGKNQQPESLL